MTNKSFATLGTLALFAAASAFGQTNLTADIPFEFSFANTVMPSGHYDLTHSPSLLVVRGFTSGAAGMSVTNNINVGTNGGTESRMVFNRYGDKYFLAEAWSGPGHEWEVSVSQSKTEREIARTSPDVARVTIPLRTGAVALASLR